MMGYLIGLAQQFVPALQTFLTSSLGGYAVRGAVLEVDRREGHPPRQAAGSLSRLSSVCRNSP